MGELTQAQEISERLNSEIRRGALVLAVLGQLITEQYGYSLRKRLADKGLAVEEGTLYPLIRRLEKQGLLCSEWREDGKRKKRFYQLSILGEEVYQVLADDWRTLNDRVANLTPTLSPTLGSNHTEGENS